jgi:hypothetical protein
MEDSMLSLIIVSSKGTQRIIVLMGLKLKDKSSLLTGYPTRLNQFMDYPKLLKLKMENK